MGDEITKAGRQPLTVKWLGMHGPKAGDGGVPITSEFHLIVPPIRQEEMARMLAVGRKEIGTNPVQILPGEDPALGSFMSVHITGPFSLVGVVKSAGDAVLKEYLRPNEEAGPGQSSK